MKYVELEQFLHAFTSRGFDSISWAFLFSKDAGLEVLWLCPCTLFSGRGFDSRPGHNEGT